MSTFMAFHGGNGGAGGGAGAGDGGRGPTLGSGQNNKQDTGPRTIDPGQSTLLIRRGE
jgi:hypothetical protein